MQKRKGPDKKKAGGLAVEVIKIMPGVSQAVREEILSLLPSLRARLLPLPPEASQTMGSACALQNSPVDLTLSKPVQGRELSREKSFPQGQDE